MNLSSFEYFQALAAEGSFTRAAMRLHVTQQTLSAHIAGLERELDCRLVIRSTPLRLTHEGEAFLAHAKTIDEDLIRLRRELHDKPSKQTGSLRLGIAHTRGRVLLPPIIREFCRTYPHVSLDVRESSNDEMYRALAAGELDLAIGTFEHALPGIDFLDYFEERVALLVNERLLKECGIDPDDIEQTLSAGDLSPLAQCPFVLGPPQDITGELALRFIADSDFTPYVRVRSSNMETLLGLALQGIGASISPVNLVEATATPAQKRGLRMYDLGPQATYKVQFGLPRGYRWQATSEFMRIALKN